MAMGKKNNSEKFQNNEDYFLKIKPAGNVPKALLIHQHKIAKLFEFPMLNRRSSNVIGFAAGVEALRLVSELNPSANIYTDSFTAYRWINDGKANTGDDLVTGSEEAMAYLKTIEESLKGLPNRSSIKYWAAIEV